MSGSTGNERTNRRWTLARRPEGEPEPGDFELTEAAVPEPGPDEVLLRTLYLSVDPYMRGRMRDAPSYAPSWQVGDVMSAGAVAEVVESAHSGFEAGDVVVGQLEWAEYSVAPGHQLHPVDPDRGPISTALGVLGMPGRTAYFGLLRIAEPVPGDTVVVSGAAGAVGSVVGQIARMAGCRVVGIAGSDRKIDFITDECGMDVGINYRTENVRDRIAEACPDGVDVYFDNVGGPVTDAVLAHLARNGRVAICGQISLYNATETPVGPRHLPRLIATRGRIQGFLVFDFAGEYEEADRRLSDWVRNGDIVYRETVTDGIESAPEAFIGLFRGDNIGKQLVKVAERS